MQLIKSDLKQLGIIHDKFFQKHNSSRDLVNKTVKQLQIKNVVEEGFLEPPKGEPAKNWKKSKD